MTTIYTQGARLSGIAAFVCAVLAVLAHPGVARADEDCGSYCEITYNPITQEEDYNSCVALCQMNFQAGSGCNTSCSNTCVDSYPNCSFTNTGCTAPGKGGCGDCKCKDGSAGPKCTCE